MRIVADISSLVSGFLWSGPSSRVVLAAEGPDVVLVLTNEMMAQLDEVLSRQKFKARVAAIGLTVDTITGRLAKIAEMVEPAVVAIPANLRDPDDLAVLACAVAAEADLIVSGDKDLLSLGSFRGIPIVSAIAAARTLGYA